MTTEIITRGWPEPLVYESVDDLTGGGASALFNASMTHRYWLTRTWGTSGLVMTFCMLNSSTADAFAVDPTVSRCIGFAKREGCDGIAIGNLYGYRTPSPTELWQAEDPVGPCNDRILTGITGPVVVAWGALPARAHARAKMVMGMLTEANIATVCLGTTRDGWPVHPLARGRSRVRDDAPLVPWAPPDFPASPPPKLGSAPVLSPPRGDRGNTRPGSGRDAADPDHLPPPAAYQGKGETAGGGEPPTRGVDAWKAAETANKRELRSRVIRGSRGRYSRGQGRTYGPGMNRRDGAT